MRIILIIALLGLIGCTKKPNKEDKPFVREYSSDEREYLSSLNLEEKLLINNCLVNEYYTFARCIDLMRSSLRKCK